ncbi:hypothetical protein ACFL4K_01235 [Candidatus Neomarinimicrobiota bacterium]
MKPIVFSVSVLLLCPTCEEPAPQPKLTGKTYGGIFHDLGFSVQQTSDGGYIFTGDTFSFGAGGIDIWLVKTDAAGDTVWNKTFGGSSEELSRSVQQTSEGGYIVVGYTNSFGAGDMDTWLIKTNEAGNTVWTRTYGGSQDDRGYFVQQTSDSGYVITGETSSYGAGGEDIWLIKTDASGDTVWTRTFGGSQNDRGYTVHQTSDEGYIIVGGTGSFGAGDDDVWVIKTDALGDTVWTKTFGGSDGDWGYSIQQTSDVGYIVAGLTESYGSGNSDIWLIKMDALGDTVWTKTYGGSNNDWGYDVQQTTDGGYIIAGETTSKGSGPSDAWLIKTGPSGDMVWNKLFGGNKYETGYTVRQNANGGYVLLGFTSSYGEGGFDVLLIITDEDGNPL